MKKTITLLLFGLLITGGLYAQVQVLVTSPSNLAGPLTVSIPTDWGAAVETPITGEAAVANDGSAIPQEGCVASPANAYEGKIVFIRRGSCEFGLKTLNAQNAGAIAVIIVNNLPTQPPPGMAGGVHGLEITIPVFATTLEEGNEIIAALDNSEVVEINIRRANFTFGKVIYPVNYTAIPKAANNEVISKMGMSVSNNSRTELSNVVLKYQFVDEAGEIYATDSFTLETFASDEIYTHEWDLSSDPISISDLPVGNYGFEYLVYNEGDPVEQPGDNILSHDFAVTTDLWSHENGASISYRPNAGGDHVHASVYQIPETLSDSVVNFKATSMTFLAANNAETTMEGKSVWVYLARLAVDPADFDPALSIFEDSQFEIVGYNNHVFTDESQRFALVTIPLFDFNTDEEGVILQNGSEYWAAISYSGDANLLFNGYSSDITYPEDAPFRNSFVYLGESWTSFGDSSGIETGVGRLGLEYVFTIGTDMTELPDETVKVFPNPASSNVFVQFDFEKSTDASIIVTDINGKVVLLKEYSGLLADQVEINTNNLPAGMYILNTTTTDSYKSIKLMIQK